MFKVTLEDVEKYNLRFKGRLVDYPGEVLIGQQDFENDTVIIYEEGQVTYAPMGNDNGDLYFTYKGKWVYFSHLDVLKKKEIKGYPFMEQLKQVLPNMVDNIDYYFKDRGYSEKDLVEHYIGFYKGELEDSNEFLEELYQGKKPRDSIGTIEELTKSFEFKAKRAKGLIAELEELKDYHFKE